MSTIKLPTQLVKPHFSVIQKQERKNLTDFIIDELKSISVDGLKLDPDFLKYLAELVENQINSSTAEPGTKPDKMSVIVDILRKLFPSITEAEIESSKNIIEFLLKQGLIKKVKLSDVFQFYLKKRFFGPV